MSRLLPAPWLLAAWTLALLLGSLASGCSSPPAAPALNVALAHRAGRALGDVPPAVAPVLDTDPAAALALSIEWYAMPAGPDDGLLPIGVHALAVAGSGGDDPFTAAPLIVGSARVALGEQAATVAGRLRVRLPSGAQGSRLLASQLDALPVGATVVLDPGPVSIELSRLDPDASAASSTGVELALVRDGQVPLGRVRHADAVEEALDPEEPESDADAERRAEAEQPVAWREVVQLDTLLQPGGPPAVIALPAARGGQLVAVLEVREAPTEAEALAQHAALLAQCLADIAASSALAAAQAQAMDAVESKHRQLLAAARAMAADGDRRRAAVFLAAESGADLALDTVLVAQSADLDDLAAAWRKASAGGDSGDDGAGGDDGADRIDDEQLVQGDRLAWGLERTTALWLAQRSESAALPAELEAVLLRHTGVVGRSPGLLEQFAAECDGVQAWRTRLEQENRLALADSMPGARVRAFDWLSARALAPAGYDPLAPRAERQAALLAADEAP